MEKELKRSDLYTSMEQSLELLRLGFNRNTADCVYGIYTNGEKPENGDADLNSVCQFNDGKCGYIEFHDQHIDELPGSSMTAFLHGVLVLS